MAQPKTHFVSIIGDSACNRTNARTSNVVSRVTCLLCKNTSEWQEAYRAMKAAQEARFQAQIPSTVVPQFGRVNDDGVMECYECGGVLFRERPRSLFSYHYVCEACGRSTHPSTETGMCT